MYKTATRNAYTKDNPRKFSVDPKYIGLFITLNGKLVTFTGSRMLK